MLLSQLRAAAHLELPKLAEHSGVVYKVLEGAGSRGILLVDVASPRAAVLGVLVQLQQSQGGDAVQSRMQRLERCALRKQHEQAIHAPANQAYIALFFLCNSADFCLDLTKGFCQQDPVSAPSRSEDKSKVRALYLNKGYV